MLFSEYAGLCQDAVPIAIIALYLSASLHISTPTQFELPPSENQT